MDSRFIKITTLKRLYCTATLFLTAWAALSAFGEHDFETPWSIFFVFDLQQRDWARIAVFATVFFTGWFFLPRYIGEKGKISLLAKSAFGFAVSTYLCAISFLYSKSVYQITIDKYDEKYGSSLINDFAITALIFAPIGVVLTIPFWLAGSWITQLIWLHFND